MKANQNIEDEKWARLAKQIYQPDALPKEAPSAKEADRPAGSEEEELQQLAKKVDLYFELKKYPAQEAWEKVQQKIHRQPQRQEGKIRRLIAHPLMRIAAALVVAGMLAVTGYEMVYHLGTSGEIVDLRASNGAVRTYTLPDGSKVSLNSDTHLQYPEQFGEQTREVTIEGEAFFEVTPNPQKPFIIHAGKAQIKVLGTSFNVRAYSDAQLMEVIVKTGKVQVLNLQTETEQHDELILTPGEKGTLVRQSNALLKSINENPNYIAWKTHDLVFRATALNEVITDLENVYKVSIQLQDPELGKQLLTAHFNNYSLDFILEVIETTFGMETLKVDGQYMLKAKP